MSNLLGIEYYTKYPHALAALYILKQFNLCLYFIY